MNKIHSHQAFSILLLSGAWSVICIPTLYGSGQIIGTAVACLMQMLFCLPMLALRQESFSRLIQSQKWLGLIYLCFFVICGAQGFSQLWEAAPSQLLPSSGKFTAAVLIVMTCFYTSSSGLRATARCAPLVMSIFMISVFVLILGAWRRIDISRISWTNTDFWKSVRLYFSLSGELSAAWILSDRIQGNKKTAIHGYLAAKACFSILILFLSLTAGGRLISLRGYPFFTLTALSQPLQGQRADALFILVFVMLNILHTTLQTGLSQHISEMLYDVKEKWAAPASLFLMVLIAWLIDFTMIQNLILIIQPILFLIIPLMLRIRQFSQTIHKKEHFHEAY